MWSCWMMIEVLFGILTFMLKISLIVFSITHQKEIILNFRNRFGGTITVDFETI
mgnify:CR=1 FL=1